MVLEATPK